MKKIAFIIVILFAVACLFIGGYMLGKETNSGEKTENATQKSGNLQEILTTLSESELANTDILIKQIQTTTVAVKLLDQVKSNVTQNQYVLPQVGSYMVIPVQTIQLENPISLMSFFQYDYDLEKSYVLILTDQKENKPQYHYFISLIDTFGNGIPLTSEEALTPSSVEIETAKQKVTSITSLATLSKEQLNGNDSLQLDQYLLVS